MDKLKMHSPNLSQDNIKKIRELFPGCVTEAGDSATGMVRLAVGESGSGMRSDPVHRVLSSGMASISAMRRSGEA